MCVIVHQPTGKSLTKEDATKLWKTNPDGGGFAFINDDRELVVEKHMDFDGYWRAFENNRSQFPRRPFLMHMRIATHGSVDIDNVHPFQVDEHTVMAHNGILHHVAGKIPKDRDITDTQMFIEEVLPNLPETWLDNEYLRKMVDDYIGWSKLMFVTNNPKLEYNVYRLGDWKEHKGLYLSNDNGLHEIPARQWTTLPTGRVQTKQLPSPTRSEYTETTDDWNEWINYRESEIKEDKPLDDWEYELLLDALKTERVAMGIMHSLVVIDKGAPEIECWGCMAPVDLETAECKCFELVCGGCWDFKAFCQERTGECTDNQKLFEYETLSDLGKDYVAKGGRNKNTTKPDQLQTAIDKVVDNLATAKERNTKLI